MTSKLISPIRSRQKKPKMFNICGSFISLGGHQRMMMISSHMKQLLVPRILKDYIGGKSISPVRIAVPRFGPSILDDACAELH